MSVTWKQKKGFKFERKPWYKTYMGAMLIWVFEKGPVFLVLGQSVFKVNECSCP